MSRRPLILILGAAVILAAVFTFYRRANPPAFEMLEPQSGAVSTQELPRLWQIPEFSLTDRTGKTVTLAQLQGFIWVADFIYTTCPGPCPMLSSRMGELQKELGAAAELRFVSISTDPANDTPEVLAKYAEHYHASDHWLFLTGEKAAIYDLANKGFKVSVVEDKGNPEGPIVHSTKILLIDRNGTVRGAYDGLTQEGKGKLLRDIQVLRAEPK